LLAIHGIQPKLPGMSKITGAEITQAAIISQQNLLPKF